MMRRAGKMLASGREERRICLSAGAAFFVLAPPKDRCGSLGQDAAACEE
jgi:hypothetical protein